MQKVVIIIRPEAKLITTRIVTAESKYIKQERKKEVSCIAVSEVSTKSRVSSALYSEYNHLARSRP